MYLFLLRNSSEKDFFDKGNISSRHKLDKNSERNKARENVIDEIPTIEKGHQKKSINMNMNYPQINNNNNMPMENKYLFNKDQPISTNRTKNVNNMINMNLNNYSKPKPKGGK